MVIIIVLQYLACGYVHALYVMLVKYHHHHHHHHHQRHLRYHPHVCYHSDRVLSVTVGG